MLLVGLSRSPRLKLGASLITQPGFIGDNPAKYHRFRKWLTICRVFPWHDTIVRRLHHVILILIGRAPYAYSTERWSFEMALDKFTVAAAELKTAADALIAHCSGHEAQITQLTSDLANADDTATAAIQPVIDELNAALPPAA